MYNKVILVGNLTRDVEIRYTSSGSALSKVGIATNRRFKSATGEMKDEVMFIDLTFFGRTAEVANQYLRKGSKVLVEGRLVLEQWTAQDGTKRSRHSVTVESMQMLDTRAEAAQNNQYSNAGYNNNAPDMGAPAQTQQQGYNQPQQNSYQQQPSTQQPPVQQSAPKQPSEPNIPEIDIDEDEIPF
jgi:single-strand DNA-binding protein